MEGININVGWKTILLVQFQPQYVLIILLFIFVSASISVFDVSRAHLTKGQGYHPHTQELLWGLDAIYLFDIIIMTIFKIMDWEEAKKIYRSRGTVLILIELVLTVPICLCYKGISGKEDTIYSWIRIRYAVRLIRLFHFIKQIKTQVGHNQLFINFRELLIVLCVFMLTVNLIVFLLMVYEEFRTDEFFTLMYFTIIKTIGKGASYANDSPHSGLIPLLIFTFMAYIGSVYYVSLATTSIMHKMQDKFHHVNSVDRILNLVKKWRYHSSQMHKTVVKYYKETWKHRRTLKRFDTFDVVIPETMAKDIKLDICWNALKHSHLFRNMPIHYLRHLAELTDITSVTPGELIFKKGKFKSKMIYIMSGVVQVLSEEDGETPILSLSGGTCLGESTLLIDQPSSCTVVCQSYAEICVLERKNFFKSYKLYPNEFLQLFKITLKRFDEAKHYVKINKFQIKNSEWSTNSQVLTMKWIKNTLYKMLNKEKTGKNITDMALTNLDDRIYENLFDEMIFCPRYLDLLVIAEECELETDRILLKATCPIIFQPDSIILNIWQYFVGAIVTFLMLTYSFYVCVSSNSFNLYTIFMIFVILVWVLDIYLQLSTAIKTKHGVTSSFLNIFNERMGQPLFWVDIVSTIPLELFYGLVTINEFDRTYRLLQINKLLKCYRIFHLFDIQHCKSSKTIIFMVYLKYLVFMLIILTNIASFFLFLMLNGDQPTTQFMEYLERRSINFNLKSKVGVVCYFLTFEFIGGLSVGEYPCRNEHWFIIIQAIYFFVEIYFIAYITAAETLRNKNKIRYHEFVSSVNTVMKTWYFELEFRRRVLKFCRLQWEYDCAMFMLHQEKLFANVPYDLFKIGYHITFGKSVSKIPILQELSDETLAHICCYINRNIIPPGEVITYSGEVCKEMYIIENGYCQMISQSRTTAKILGPGDSFSVLETCLNVSTVNTVITLTTVRVLSLTFENYLRSLRFYPQVLTEINSTINTAIDWVAFEQLLNKEFLDIESYTEKVKSFNYFGYQLDKDSKEYEAFHEPYNKVYMIKFLKYVLMHLSITPYGTFIKGYEIARGIFAFLAVFFSPITVISIGDYRFGWYVLIMTDVVAGIDLYVRHHISYFNNIGIEITHPLSTAKYYWSHGLFIDLCSFIPLDTIVPAITRKPTTSKMTMFLRLNRLLQVGRLYQQFNYYIYTTGSKAVIIVKYFTLIVVLFNFISAVVINLKCGFNTFEVSYKYTGGVSCNENSWISPIESFRQPYDPLRVYAYGLYFIAIVTTFKGIEGFAVFEYKEIVELVAIISIMLLIYPYVSAKIIASVMYKNAGLVVYQNAMSSLVKFMNYRKIDTILKNEVIEHFEHIWHKKKGRDERKIFKIFNIALHEDALYYIYGKEIEHSSIFKGASKSFFKSLLLNFRHEMILNRGIISRVNNVHGLVFFLFKGQVSILGPDHSRLEILNVGSVFGTLDNVATARQTLSFIAKGHVEILCIQSTLFHSILSKYRGIRLNFKSLTAINVDYLINTSKNEESKKEKKGKDVKRQTSSSDKKRSFIKHPKLKCKCSKCVKCSKCSRCCSSPKCTFFSKVHLRSTPIKIWNAIILSFVCFLGYIFELYQKNSKDMSATMLALLYLCDFLFIINIYLKFHTAYDDERGILVTDKVLIAKRYIKDITGFPLDCISVIPVDVIAFCFSGKIKRNIWTYTRLNRLVRIISVLNFFQSVNQKLNINVFFMRVLSLMTWVIIMLQFLVYILFLVATTDDTMEQFSAVFTRNYKLMTYFKQVKVVLNLFTGCPIEEYMPNSWVVIIMTTYVILITRFIVAVLIAELCATLEIVFFNKTNYESKITKLKDAMKRGEVSPPLYARVWLYVKLLWTHHKGEQFPSLLDEAPYYLKEGVLNSMFGFHLRDHPVLQNCHMDLIRQMASFMTTRIFFSGDYLAFEGDIDECMYFIHQGEVQVLSDDNLYSETVEFVLTSNQMFGLEQGIYERCGHEYTYRASKYCFVVVLRRRSWIHMLTFFPASKYLIFDKAFQSELLKRYTEDNRDKHEKPNLPKRTKISKMPTTNTKSVLKVAEDV